MRTIDTSALKALGSKGAGPWRMDDNKLLRVLSGNRVIPTEEEAREMLEIYRACASVVDSPQGFEVVRLADGFGVVVDYVCGVSLSMHLIFGSFTPEEAGHLMGVFLRELHGHHMEAGKDFNTMFRQWAHMLEPLLPTGYGTKLVELVEAIPKRSCLLHGDYHIGNVLVRNGELALIDMEAAGFGHPVFDLAVSRSRMINNVPREAECMGIDMQLAEHLAHIFWTKLLEGYFEGIGADELAQLEKQIVVLNGLERCCFNYGMGRTGLHGLTERQQAPFNRYIGQLTELLPQIDRLDF